MTLPLPYADFNSSRIRNRRLRIFHCADFHLRTIPKSVEKFPLDLFSALTNTVELCLREKVDLLLIAGDFLESQHATAKTAELAIDALAELSHIPVLMVTGNHDPLEPHSLYCTQDWGEHVIIVGDTDVVELPDLNVRVWCTGFSKRFQDSGRLSCPGISRRNSSNDDFLEIGLAHADVCGGVSRYNPLTRRAIASSALDYLALGHIHQPSETVLWSGDTAYAYAGCPMGQGFSDLGPRGGWLLSFSGTRFSADYIPLSDSMFLERDLDISLPERLPVWRPEQLSSFIQRNLEKLDGPIFSKHHYRLVLKGNLRGQIIDLDALGDLLADVVREVRLEDETGPDLLMSDLATENSVRGVFVRQLLADMKIAREAQDDESVKRFSDILQIGLSAFDGEVV